MLEYVLFSRELTDRFISWLKSSQVEHETKHDGEEWLIMVDENIDESTQELIETKYDQLLEENARMTDEEDAPGDAIHLVGIQFTRRDGVVGMVRISPELANRLQGCMGSVELQSFVQAVVDAAEDPECGSLCRKQEPVIDD